MDRETKAFALEVEEFKSEEGKGLFSGWLSVFGNEDLGHDVVEQGAFTKTLQERKQAVPILWQHDDSQPVGVFRDMREESMGGPSGKGGLRVKGELNLKTQRGSEAYELLKQGALSGLSIGYGVVKHGFDGNKRLLKELRLHEGSLVTFPMNQAATVDAVKAGAAGDFPLAPRDTPWDAPAAVMRLREKLGATKKPNADYAKCFFVVDSGNADSFGAYHMPFCDVIGGSVKAVPHAIFAAAADISGGHGETPSYADSATVRALIARYYDKMRSEFSDESIHAPWEHEHQPKATDLAEATAALTVAIEGAKALLDTLHSDQEPEPDELASVIGEMKSLLTQPASATGDAGADTEIEREALDILRTMRAEMARAA